VQQKQKAAFMNLPGGGVGITETINVKCI